MSFHSTQRLKSLPHLCLILVLALPISGQQARVVTDETAYHHLFMTLAPLTGTSVTQPSPEEVADRQSSYAQHIGLNPTQAETLKLVAGKYHAYMSRIQAEATQRVGIATTNRRLRSAESALLRQIASGRKDVLSQLVVELYEGLDDQGDRIIADFIRDEVKPRVVFQGGASQ